MPLPLYDGHLKSIFKILNVLRVRLAYLHEKGMSRQSQVNCDGDDFGGLENESNLCLCIQSGLLILL